MTSVSIRPPISRSFLEFIFYGNYFYGICAVAQSIEATLQQRFPLNSPIYYVFVFFITVLYYNYPYVRKYLDANNNPRTVWYIKHYRLVLFSQIAITMLLLAIFVFFLWPEREVLFSVAPVNWLLIFIFPGIAGGYYGLNFVSRRFGGHYNLRRVGWLKPFIIGFTWSGLVTVYPVLESDLLRHLPYEVTMIGCLLFVKNFMFISMLAIMFDVKDYATDYANRLRTFIVQLGLRKTVLFILLPLPVIGLFTFLSYATIHEFHPVKIVLNAIPFILLVVVALSLSKRRSLMYYLIVVDGLMLLKATCGITAMLLF